MVRGDVPRIALGCAWVLTALAAPWHVAADGRSTAVSLVLMAWGWLGWTAVAAGLLAPLPVSLTVIRCTVPLALAAAIAGDSLVAMATCAAALVLMFDADLADRMANGGAYGQETRFSLRTPVPHMAPAVVAWLVLAFTTVGGSLMTAASNYGVGLPIFLVGIAIAMRAPMHLHRLSRRWLVLVPAGMVVHDHLVLAETFMVRTSRIESVAAVDASDEDADLTGGTVGRRLSVHMREADKVVLSPITARTLGTTEALHVKGFCVAPLKVDAVLSALSGSPSSAAAVDDSAAQHH